MILADAYELISAVIVECCALAVNEDIFDVVALRGLDGEAECFAARDVHRLGAYLAALGLDNVDLEIIGDLTVCIAVVAGIRVHPVAYRPGRGEGRRRRNIDGAAGGIELLVCHPAAQMISVVVDKRQAHLSALILKHADDAAALVAVERCVAYLYRAVIVDLSAAGRSYAGVALDIERCALLYRKLAAAGYLVRISGIKRRVYDKFAAVERQIIRRRIIGFNGLYRQALLGVERAVARIV